MIGYFARSIAGHDKGQLYIVVGYEDNKVCLSDGRLKRVEQPKKKNKKHIQIISRDCGFELDEMIKRGDKAINEAVKRAIKLYEREEKNV